MTTQQRKEWASKIAEYILANEPVTLDALEERARGHAWYSINEFDAILLLLKKDTRISATLVKDGIIYKKKREYVSPLAAERDRVQKWNDDHYPREELGPSPFKICFCMMWRTEEESDVWREGDKHLSTCDAVLFPEEWREQNLIRKTLSYGIEGEQDPTRNTQVAS